jgi:hypothetical protein
MSRCRSCNALITWCVTAAGVRMPVDAEPSPGGNVVVSGTLARVLRKGEVAEGPLYRSHHSTCPQGRQWRRRKSETHEGGA